MPARAPARSDNFDFIYEATVASGLYAPLLCVSMPAGLSSTMQSLSS